MGTHGCVPNPLFDAERESCVNGGDWDGVDSHPVRKSEERGALPIEFKNQQKKGFSRQAVCIIIPPSFQTQIFLQLVSRHNSAARARL
jgi:hypothetical protein